MVLPGGRPWEVGSEFHWSDDVLVAGSTTPPPWLPPGHRTFASGAGALVELLARLGPRRVHLPSFYCMDVVDVLRDHVETAWYRELPDRDGPHLATVDASPGDVVVAVNLFGCSRREPWDDWRRARPDVVMVEDHTHDPLSDWATASRAPYCFASLRKTLPIPDGAVLWSPRGLPLPDPSDGDNVGGALKLEAMRLKAAWLAGDTDVAKEDFRRLQLLGEEAITGSTTPVLPFTDDVLPRIDAHRLRNERAANVRRFLTSAVGRSDPRRGWRTLTRPRAGAVPFNVQLACRDAGTREGLARHLAVNGVFAAVHWHQSPAGTWSGDRSAARYGERVLTIPLDHRLDAADVDRVLTVLQRSVR